MLIFGLSILNPPPPPPRTLTNRCSSYSLVITSTLPSVVTVDSIAEASSALFESTPQNTPPVLRKTCSLRKKISSTTALPGVRLQAVRRVGVPYDIHSPDDPKLLEQIWHKDYVSIILESGNSGCILCSHKLEK